MNINILFVPTFEEEGVYCFTNVGRSVGRPDGFRWLSWKLSSSHLSIRAISQCSNNFLYMYTSSFICNLIWPKLAQNMNTRKRPEKGISLCLWYLFAQNLNISKTWFLEPVWSYHALQSYIPWKSQKKLYWHCLHDSSLVWFEPKLHTCKSLKLMHRSAARNQPMLLSH